jgi:hypothetical protein
MEASGGCPLVAREQCLTNLAVKAWTSQGGPWDPGGLRSHSTHSSQLTPNTTWLCITTSLLQVERSRQIGYPCALTKLT